MKVHVITDERGDVVATVRASHGSHGDTSVVAAPEALPGQKLHHIELPKDLEGVHDADELHRRIKQHIR